MELAVWVGETPRHQDLWGTGSDPKVRASVPSKGKFNSHWMRGWTASVKGDVPNERTRRGRGMVTSRGDE